MVKGRLLSLVTDVAWDAFALGTAERRTLAVFILEAYSAKLVYLDILDRLVSLLIGIKQVVSGVLIICTQLVSCLILQTQAATARRL